MLIRFNVSNYLSFKEETEFNMLAGSLRTHQHHVYTTSKVNVLKATAIYGANGAGKSNLIKAIDFLKQAVLDGKISNSSENDKFRLDKTLKDKPSSFEIEFSIGKKIYTYGIAINHGNVEEEWLFETGVNADGKLIFERKQTKNAKIKIDFADKYTETSKQKLLVELMEDNLLKNNELLLSKIDLFNIEALIEVKNWFNDYLIIIYPKTKFGGLLESFLFLPNFKELVNKLIGTLDSGVQKIDLINYDYDSYFGENDKERYDKRLIENNIIFENKKNIIIIKENDKKIVLKLVTTHLDNSGNETDFELNQESDGTQRLFDILPVFFMILENDTTFLIDEIDQSLHPSLLVQLVEKILTDKNTKGQFIFTTHESNLLDFNIFRQDEIWFAEKDRKEGSTKIYSLNEYKPRYDLDIRKGYLKGRFGGVPFLADLEELNWASHGV